MALKPTIYKFSITLADIDRNRYDDVTLTVAQHPSETLERMMARVLAYCLNCEDDLSFTRGLSENDEPDLWRHSLDGQILDWIEVGEPSADRLRKASRLARAVTTYTFNTRSEVWWQQVGTDAEKLGVSVYRFPWPSVQALAALTERTTELSVTITRPSIFVAGALGEVDIDCVALSDGA